MHAPFLTVGVLRQEADHVVVAAAGEVDYNTYLPLQEELYRQVDAGGNRIVLDLGGVTMCDSTGLSVLVRVHRRVKAQGGWLRLADVQPVVHRALALTNLDRLLPLFATVQDAVADLPGPAATDGQAAANAR